MPAGKIEREREEKERGQDGLDVEERAQASWRSRDRDWMKRGRGDAE